MADIPVPKRKRQMIPQIQAPGGQMPVYLALGAAAAALGVSYMCLKQIRTQKVVVEKLSKNTNSSEEVENTVKTLKEQNAQILRQFQEMQEQQRQNEERFTRLTKKTKAPPAEKSVEVEPTKVVLSTEED